MDVFAESETEFSLEGIDERCVSTTIRCVASSPGQLRKSSDARFSDRRSQRDEPDKAHDDYLNSLPKDEVATAATAGKVTALGASILAAFGIGHGLEPLNVDAGTRISPRIIIEAQPSTTRLFEINSDTGKMAMGEADTLMADIRRLAPLSLRDWATVFGVSHTAIRDWLKTDPDRPELTQVLGLLEDASGRRADLAAWLTQPLEHLNVRPLDLLASHRWRAFRGAMRVRQAPVPITPAELKERRKSSLGWAMTDAPTVPEPE